MKASLDTNVIIHLYRTNNQELLFKMFDEEIYIDGFVYDVELQNHGKDILSALTDDIAKEKIKLVITVDCATSDVAQINLLKSFGVDTIITESYTFSTASAIPLSVTVTSFSIFVIVSWNIVGNLYMIPYAKKTPKNIPKIV